jgi:hypothetical protein
MSGIVEEDMNRDETRALIALLQLDRPEWPKLKTKEQFSAMIDLWTETFADYDSVIVRKAANNFLKHNPYDPKIADIQAEIDALAEAVSDNTIEKCIEESWKAICGSKTFKELSEPSRMYWGSQNVIDTAGYDEMTTYGVVAGQMQRRLPDIMARLKVKKEITPEIEVALKNMLNNNTKQITGGE